MEVIDMGRGLGGRDYVVGSRGTSPSNSAQSAETRGMRASTGPLERDCVVRQNASSIPLLPCSPQSRTGPLLRVPRLETLEFELVCWSKVYRSDLYHFADQVGHLLQQAKIIRLNTDYERCEKLESDLVYFLERAHSLRELLLCTSLARVVGRRILEDEVKRSGWGFSICTL